MREYSEEEYFIKFQVEKCPKCGSREIRENQRTHQDIKYIVMKFRAGVLARQCFFSETTHYSSYFIRAFVTGEVKFTK